MQEKLSDLIHWARVLVDLALPSLAFTAVFKGAAHHPIRMGMGMGIGSIMFPVCLAWNNQLHEFIFLESF